MSSFTTPLIVEYRRKDRWRLVESFVYDVGGLGSGERIYVPAGFITDFASIPRIIWSIWHPTGPWGKAAVIHDWLYACLGRGRADKRYTRKECDLIFLEAMEVLQVPKRTRYLFYWAVRVAGRFAWRKHEKKYESVWQELKRER